MSLQIRLLLTILLIIGIFLADIVANKLYLYWTYVGLDKVMHFLGGLATGFIILIVLQYAKKTSHSFLFAFLGSLIVGIAWEIVEYVLHISTYASNFILDTSGDLLMDIMGGFVSYFVWVAIPQKQHDK